MHSTVTSLLLCTFSSSLIVSYQFSHRVFVFLMPPSKRFFWPVFIDLLAPSSPPTVSWSGTSSPSPVPVGMLFRHFVLGRLFLHLLAGMSLLLFGHQPPLYGLVGFRAFALVVDILWHQRSHRGDYCTHCLILGNSKTTPFPASSAFSVCDTTGKRGSRHSFSVEATGF